MNHNGAYWRDERYEEHRQAYWKNDDFRLYSIDIDDDTLDTIEQVTQQNNIADRRLYSYGNGFIYQVFKNNYIDDIRKCDSDGTRDISLYDDISTW